MKRAYVALAVLLVVLIGAGLLFVNLSQTAGVAGALRRLGGGDQEFEYVRKKVLFTMGDPAPALYAFVGRHSTNRQARLQALRILEELAAHEDLTAGGRYVSPQLDDTSRAIRLQALKTLGAMKSMPGMAPVIGLYRTATDTAVFRACYRALKAASEPLNTALDAAMRQGDTLRIDSCIRVLDTYPVDKGRLLSKLARYCSVHGDYERAGDFYRRMGVPSCWWAVGEFVVEHPDDPTKVVLSPELRAFSPTDTFNVGGGLVSRWFALNRISGWGDIDMRALFSRQENTAAYFRTYVTSPTARRALIFVHTDDGACVWLNDSLVTVTPGFQGYMTNEDVVDVRLHAGANALMVKVAQGGWGWGMFLRLAGVDGQAMPDIAFSLSPTPAQHVVDSVLARAVRGDMRWRTAIDSLGADDDLANQLLNVIADKGGDGGRRLAALGVLRALNGARKVPAGERELVQLGSSLASQGASSKLLFAVAEALLDMGTTRGLDLGLAMRTTDTPQGRWLGNRLVNAYCRGRFMSVGRLDERDRRPLVARTVSDIASLAPTDPWVAERMAAFWELEGDTARATAMLKAFAMPRRWAVRAAGCTAAQLASLACVKESDTKGDSAFLAGAAPAAPWRLIGADALERHGLHLTLVPDANKLHSRDVYVVRTMVESDSACTTLVSVTLPAPYALFVNGVLTGSIGSPTQARYDYGDDYPWQRLRYDGGGYPATLHRGLNNVEVAFINDWVTDAALHALRVGFADPEGRPMGAASGHLSFVR